MTRDFKAHWKRIEVKAIPAIEEVNIFKEDVVIQFINHKVQASIGANTWVVSGIPHNKNSRLRQHVEKGNADGLYIRCVGSASNLWALIMDAGTGFSSHVYELSGVFLHKDWIMEQEEKNYYISSITGAANRSSLVVMSKGTSYTQQSYKVSESFIFKWINKKWKEGYIYDYCLSGL